MPVMSPGLAAAPPTPSGHQLDVCAEQAGGVVEQPPGGRVVLILPEHVMRGEEELSGAAEAVAYRRPEIADLARPERGRRVGERRPEGGAGLGEHRQVADAQLREPQAHEPDAGGSMAPPRRKRAGRRAFLGEAQVGPGAALAVDPAALVEQRAMHGGCEFVGACAGAELGQGPGDPGGSVREPAETGLAGRPGRP